MKAMIFAAGLGTRLRPLTDNMPKALVPLGGKTLLQYQIEKLRDAGIRDIIINIHHFPEQIRGFLQRNSNFGLNIQISDESGTLLETGGGLKKAQDFFADERPFLACNVDILSNIDIKALVNRHRQEDIATVVVSERATQRYLLFDETERLIGWTNLKTGEVRPDNLQPAIIPHRRLAFSGMQILSADLFRHMEHMGERFSLIDLYLSLCRQYTIRSYIPDNYRMMDVGKTECLAEAEQFARNLFS